MTAHPGTDTRSCVTGCKRRDRHLLGCPCAGEHDVEHDDHCRGCEPRRADHGNLCVPCHKHLSDSVLGAPALIAHLRAQVAPATSSDGGEHVGGTKEPPAPLSVPAVDAADELHATLVSWALEAAEQRGLPGPRLTGTRFTRSYVHDDGSVQRGRPQGLHRVPSWGASGLRTHDVVVEEHEAPMRDSHGVPIRYLTARRVARPRPAMPADTVVVAGWLRTHQDWIEGQDWAGAMVTELRDQTRTALARWPMESQARAIQDVPCPACERLTLTYTPPAFEGASVVVQCSRVDCAHRIDEAYWPHYAHLLEQVHADQARAARAAS